MGLQTEGFNSWVSFYHAHGCPWITSCALDIARAPDMGRNRPDINHWIYASDADVVRKPVQIRILNFDRTSISLTVFTLELCLSVLIVGRTIQTCWNPVLCKPHFVVVLTCVGVSEPRVHIALSRCKSEQARRHYAFDRYHQTQASLRIFLFGSAQRTFGLPSLGEVSSRCCWVEIRDWTQVTHAFWARSRISRSTGMILCLAP